MTDPNQMTPVDLDAAIAVEVMNAETFYWHQRDQPHKKTRDAGGIWIYAEKGGNVTSLCGHDCRLWKPSSLISDAFAAEEEIERRLMSAAYAENLMKIAWRGKSGRSTWYLIHASPLARCLAMLATVRSRDTKKPADLRSWDECQHEFFGTPMDIAIGRGRTCIRCGMAE